MFFGLSMRQLAFSAAAVIVAVGIFFLLRPYLGVGTVSWMCILGAAPFAALGFVSYHGMNAEQFLLVLLRSKLIEPRKLRCEPRNSYYELMRECIAKRERENLRERRAETAAQEKGAETETGPAPI